MRERGKSPTPIGRVVCFVLAVLLAAGGITASEVQRQRREVDDPRLAGRLQGNAALPLEQFERPAEEPQAPAQRVATGASIPDGLDWLAISQNPSGSWGAAFEFADTAIVVDALGGAQPRGLPFQRGVNWLTGHVAADQDELARQVEALLLVPGLDIEGLVDELWAGRNPATSDVLAPNWPEGGWGLERGFETDSLTTALAMSALESAGRTAGMAEQDEPLAAGTRNVHVWEIPPEATKVRVWVSSVTGSTVNVRMTEGAPPNGIGPGFGLPVGGPYNLVFPDSGIPFTAGTNYLEFESTGPAATYSFIASYETPDLDTRSYDEALEYLRQSQNVDGGWGIQIGDPTSLFVTTHVILAMLDWSAYDFEVELAAAIAYLQGEQLMDGSFGVAGTPVPYLTALAALDLVRYEVCPLSAATDDAISALAAQQDPDGSWVQEPFDTGLALRALWEYDNDGDGVFQDGDCSGTVGDNVCMAGMSVGCDDNCVDYNNPGQGDVVLGQTITAPDKSSFIWPTAVAAAFVKGDLADVSTYGFFAGGPVPFGTTLSTFADNPGPGSGIYYLLRPAGDCLLTSWQTSLGAEPARDASGLGELNVAITSPTDGAVLTGSPVTVDGTADGVDPLSVTVNGVPAVYAGGTFSASVPLVRGANVLTAMATDAGGFMGSDQITVTKVDYSIPINTGVSDFRLFSGPSDQLDQIMFYTETQIGVPAGVIYTTLIVQRISATDMRIDFQIDVNSGATPGIYFFQVEYGLLDAGMMPLGPLTGNIFDFLIEIP